MALYLSKALSNVQGMALGSKPWSRHQNDLWHWAKHARHLLSRGIVIPAEIPGIASEEQYLQLAQQICRSAAKGEPGTEVTIRETRSRDTFGKQFLVWYQPPGLARGLFLVVNDCGGFGELVTMFPPTEGRSYFDAQQKEPIH